MYSSFVHSHHQHSKGLWTSLSSHYSKTSKTSNTTPSLLSPFLPSFLPPPVSTFHPTSTTTAYFVLGCHLRPQVVVFLGIVGHTLYSHARADASHQDTKVTVSRPGHGLSWIRLHPEEWWVWTVFSPPPIFYFLCFSHPWDCCLPPQEKENKKTGIRKKKKRKNKIQEKRGAKQKQGVNVALQEELHNLVACEAAKVGCAARLHLVRQGGCDPNPDIIVGTFGAREQIYNLAFAATSPTSSSLSFSSIEASFIF